MSQYSTPNNPGYNTPANVDVNTVVATPTDRVRWGPIIAGIFTALSTLAVLSVLGLAIGLTAYDAGDDARRFGIGAGIWGALSMLLAFFFGGWLAARSAAVQGHRNGLLNGALVWAVAIPLLLFMLGGGLTNMMNSQNRMSEDEVRNVIRASAGTGSADQSSSGVTSQEQQQAAQTGRRAAWGTLLSLLLGLAAAATGGYLGARGDRDRDRDFSRGTPTPAT